MTTRTTRRTFLRGAAAGLGTAAAPAALHAARDAFEISRSEGEWRDMLTEAEFDVMRDAGTERPFSSPLNAVKEEGRFLCKGCDQALFSSDTKFESGTGWPSFWRPLENAVSTRPDRGWFMTRTEVHCDRCGSHLGHVFEDGPDPTGLRYCMNGIAMVFAPSGDGDRIIG